MAIKVPSHFNHIAVVRSRKSHAVVLGDVRHLGHIALVSKGPRLFKAGSERHLREEHADHHSTLGALASAAMSVQAMAFFLLH
jgi:hypothetical protein